MRIAILIASVATILAAVAHGQTYNIFYPPGYGMHTHWAYCVGIASGKIEYNCPLVLQTAVYAGTNAHFHYNPTSTSSKHALRAA